MEILLNNVSKRFRYDWVFKNINIQFQEPYRYVLLGPNGSGKSTLMRILAGQLTPSKGTIAFQHAGKAVALDNIYRYVSYAAPYIELIEEFTLVEILDFHQKFKPFYKDLTTKRVVELLAMEKSQNKEIRFFSSGMKQRLKLALAICSDTPLLFLDEPTTNLDNQGASWYKELLLKYSQNRLLIIATNVPQDYEFVCDTTLQILDYK
jgi:ABC-type multidrug transport system ATPase subunit